LPRVPPVPQPLGAIRLALVRVRLVRARLPQRVLGQVLQPVLQPVLGPVSVRQRALVQRRSTRAAALSPTGQVRSFAAHASHWPRAAAAVRWPLRLVLGWTN
jgi:hypothetical protein